MIDEENGWQFVITSSILIFITSIILILLLVNIFGNNKNQEFMMKYLDNLDNKVSKLNQENTIYVDKLVYPEFRYIYNLNGTISKIIMKYPDKPFDAIIYSENPDDYKIHFTESFDVWNSTTDRPK